MALAFCYNLRAKDRRGSRLVMAELEDFSALIGDIYDASLDPTLWPGVFEQACAYIGGTSSFLASQETVSKITQVHFNWGVETEYVQSFCDKYSRLNPTFPTMVFFAVEEPYGVPDCLPREEFCGTRFAKEWVNPQGYIDSLFANIDKTPASCAAFAVFRHFKDGFVDDKMRQRFSLVVPHLRRAVLIGKTLNLKTVEAAALADSLDTLSSGMFLVDATSRIVHANLSGHLMVSEATVVRAPSGKLGAIDPQADQSLLDSFTAAANGDAALGRKGIAVPLRARDDTRYVAHVLPLTSGARRKAGASYRAVATVFVHKATLELPTPPEAIAQEFRLTPAEQRVLFAIIEVGGAPEVAEVLGISEWTVKTHLRNLFDKTGTSRQVDLVKLVAGYADRLIG